jgi:hypothetical protein
MWSQPYVLVAKTNHIVTNTGELNDTTSPGCSEPLHVLITAQAADKLAEAQSCAPYALDVPVEGHLPAFEDVTFRLQHEDSSLDTVSSRFPKRG